MKRFKWFVAIVVFCAVSDQAFAEMGSATPKAGTQTKNGMTTVQITDGYKVVVPEGLKVEKIDGQIKMQDPTEFLVGKLQTLEEQLKKIDATQSDLKMQMDILESVIASLGKLYDSFGQLRRRQEQFRGELISIRESLNKVNERMTPVQIEPASQFQLKSDTVSEQLWQENRLRR